MTYHYTSKEWANLPRDFYASLMAKPGIQVRFVRGGVEVSF